MVKSIFTRGMFYWLRVPRNNADVRLDEYILAVVRLLLSTCFLGALLRADSIPGLKIYVLLYLIYSLLIIVMLYFFPLLSPVVHVGIHCADMLWATPLIVLGNWQAMSLAIFFFVMVSATLRWGFWETLATAAILGIALRIGFGLFHRSFVQLWNFEKTSEFIPEALFFIIIVCLLGFLAEAKVLRSEGNFMAAVLKDVRLESGLDNALYKICKQAIRLFGPTQVLIVLYDSESNECRLYRLSRSQEELKCNMLDSSQRKDYFFPAPAQCWRIAVHRPYSRNRFTCCMLKAGEVIRRKDRCGLPDHFLTLHPFGLMLAASHVYQSGWAVRFFMLNPGRFRGGIAGLRFLERSLHQVAPVIHDAFFADRLTARAKADASGRIARELHDGVIQSLSAINMQLEELRLQTGSVHPHASERIENIQQSIREEIAGLRDFTQQLRGLEIDSGKLLGFLSGMANKFQLEHGISTRFVSEVEEVSLPQQVCIELARIVQEALTNVRKHSDADEAVISLGQRDSLWVLCVKDNGRGFGFTGRYSHEELQASGKGPAVLMERARAIGGKVSLHSEKGGGSTLEIAFPQI